jgi:hypothetical protein
MKALQIKDWADTFETAESRRKIKAMQWFACPSGCDSNGFLTLAGMGADGVQALGMFVALCQGYSGKFKIANRDGCFRKSGGKAMSVGEIAALIRMDKSLLISALEILSSEDVAWVEWVETTPSGSHPDDIQITSGLQDSTVQDKTGQDTHENARTKPPQVNELPMEIPRSRAPLALGARCEALVHRYHQGSGKPYDAEAVKIILRLVQSETVAIDDLEAKVEAICLVLEANPRAKKNYHKSCYQFFESEAWRSSPSAFDYRDHTNGVGLVPSQQPKRLTMEEIRKHSKKQPTN